MTLSLPIGIDNFKTLITEAYHFVDKSLLAQEVWNSPAQVQLITRPRRFGKTLNLSMLYHFFNIREDNRALFGGLAIEKAPVFAECNQHPVIFISFKDLNAPDYETFLDHVTNMMSLLYDQHRGVIPHLSEAQQRDFQRMIDKKGNLADLMGALAALTRALKQAYNKSVILLIDEYDSPVHEAYRHDYYQKIVDFLRRALGEALKGNDALKKAVLTGILRISKESIFSDLNNISVVTVLDEPYCDKFGFTEAEVANLLELAQRGDRESDVRTWYNGYNIGNAVIYNPWSLLQFLNDSQGRCQPYWVNTSSNNLIHQLILEAQPSTQAIVESLMQGGTIESLIRTQPNFRNLSQSALWSLLLFSGYLTLDHSVIEEDGSPSHHLRIPNREVWNLFRDIFYTFFDERMGQSEMDKMLQALVQGDLQAFGDMLGTLVRTTLSYYDTAHDPERVYHAFVLGLLVNLSNRYTIRSNRESGYGRYDLMLIPKSPNDPGIIMEFKTAQTPDELDAALAAGMTQIKEQQYQTELKAQGISKHMEIAVAFCGKHVKVTGERF